MKLKISTFILCVLLVSNAWPAGGRTHCEMGKQAWKQFLSPSEAMLPGIAQFAANEELRRAYYCGCVFPDWGYNNGNGGDSEASHWSPFEEAYFAVLRETCPPPWSDEQKQRVAFFLGLVTHDVTDIPWHFNDGSNAAFEKRAEKEDGPANLGGFDLVCDIFAQQDCGPLPEMHGQLWFPFDDVLAAFSRTGRNVTKTQLELGRQHLTAASNLGISFAGIPYATMKSKLPWAQAHYRDYYYGGIDHGAALAAVWIKYYYAQLQQTFYFQQMPEYSSKPPDYVPYVGCEDACIIKAQPDNNTGKEPFLVVGGRNPEDDCRTLIRFDLSSIPKSVIPQTATLWMFQCPDADAAPKKPKQLGIYKANRPWNAGNGGSDPVSGCNGRAALQAEATWRNPGNGEWQTPGCDGSPDDRDETPLAALKLEPQASSGCWISFDITQAAGGWIKNPESNHGLLLKAMPEEEPNPGSFRFFSSEAFRDGQDDFCSTERMEKRPTLVIVPAHEK